MLLVNGFAIIASASSDCTGAEDARAARRQKNAAKVAEHRLFMELPEVIFCSHPQRKNASSPGIAAMLSLKVFQSLLTRCAFSFASPF
jgi:hypothetical protein